ncbi:MAG: AI-2E family transporter [Deltaproteobacteria bacterium]|nr:AI-2E family transporter [Deltaproteobacteria bacterium]
MSTGTGDPPSEGVPRPPESGPTTSRTRSRETWFGPEAPSRKFLSRWGLALFVVLMLVLGRSVLLPFVFAGLIAYILAPIVQRMTERKNGTRRMPRGLAIILCYIVFLAAVTGFMFLLVPRLSRDVARLAHEAGPTAQRIDKEYVPRVARWLEERFPSLKVVKSAPEDQPIVKDIQPPPGTAFVVTPMPDGEYAFTLTTNGVDIKPTPDGGYHVQALEAPPAAVTLEDKLRSYVKKGLVGLQSKLNDVVRVLQDIITGFIRGIFLFFFTLMIGAFILIDLEKVHAFLRSLFPSNVREDYDVIIAGIDRGLSGVIRGQLLICVINACLTYVGLMVFGVKYKFILAIVAGLMSLIPIFGSILSSIPIVIVALVSGDQGIDVFRGVAMVLWIIGIHFIEANLLNPKIIGTAAKIHPVLVIFALFLGEHSYGLVGALLAVPLLSAIQVVFMYFYRKRWKDAPRPMTGPIKPTTEPMPLPPTLPPTRS